MEKKYSIGAGESENSAKAKLKYIWFEPYICKLSFMSSFTNVFTSFFNHFYTDSSFEVIMNQFFYIIIEKKHRRPLLKNCWFSWMHGLIIITIAEHCSWWNWLRAILSYKIYKSMYSPLFSNFKFPSEGRVLAIPQMQKFIFSGILIIHIFEGLLGVEKGISREEVDGFGMADF